MNNISEFCYICFECNKNLKDLLKAEEECLELIAKLRLCVTEVDWAANKKLLICDKCIKKLNKAHEFKKQCIQSSETLKLYLSELGKTKEKKVEKKEEPLVLQYLNLMKDDKSVKKPPVIPPTPSIPPCPVKPPPIKTVPDPQIYPSITKIILTNQPNSFQNVFLNLLPQNILNKNNSAKNECNKGNFISFPHVIQITPQKDIKNKDATEEVSKLLTESKTEELSVDVDPLDFNMDNQDKCETKPIQLANNNFRPILPKLNENYDYTNEEKMEFFNSGHFLLQDIDKNNKFYCEKCSVRFESPKALHTHIKQVHSSQYPYKCEHCKMEFAAKEVYKSHLNRHTNETSELMNNSITLTDFTTNNPKINDLISQPQPEVKIEPEEKLEEEVKCNECDRVFASTQGLVRHKAKLHKSYKRKKYFVKGMKNAKCDICNRMFSTQSYMNLHRKLHDRKGEWRRKIFKQETIENQMEDYAYDNSDLDMEEEEEEKIQYRLDNVSEFLETSIQEPNETVKENDNG